MRGELLTAPTRDVPLTIGLTLEVVAAIDLGSPALSANVLRFGSGSATAKTTSICQSRPMSKRHPAKPSYMMYPICASKSSEEASSKVVSIVHYFRIR